jgi:hypothetical protein
MQLPNVVHPLLNLGRILICVLDGAYRDVAVLQLLRLGAQLQFEYGGVGLVGGGLVEKAQAKAVLLAVGPRHLNRDNKGDVSGSVTTYAQLSGSRMQIPFQ